MPRIIRNAIRCKKCGDIIESKTATITFAGAEIVRIGKSCPKWKSWRTTVH